MLVIVATQENVIGGVSRLGCYGCAFILLLAAKGRRERYKKKLVERDGALEKLGM